MQLPVRVCPSFSWMQAAVSFPRQALLFQGVRAFDAAQAARLRIDVPNVGLTCGLTWKKMFGRRCASMPVNDCVCVCECPGACLCALAREHVRVCAFVCVCMCVYTCTSTRACVCMFVQCACVCS